MTDPLWSLQLPDPAPDPVPDIAEMRLILKQIDAEPETWHQGWWATQTSCGTAYCFAGWAAKRAGYDADFDRFPNGVSTTTGGVTIRDAAVTALGITQDQAWDLFNEQNTYEDLVRIVDQIEKRMNQDG